MKSFLSVGDTHKPYTAILNWLGYSTAIIPVTHQDRYAGKSSYSYWQLLRHALSGIISYSEKPLYLSILVGLVFVVLSSCYGCYVMFAALFFDQVMPGWASTVLVVIFSSGLILLNLGISALYVGKIFEQAKQRPRFIIDRQICGSSENG